LTVFGELELVLDVMPVEDVSEPAPVAARSLALAEVSARVPVLALAVLALDVDVLSWS
jgi:hypothetical protein